MFGVGDGVMDGVSVAVGSGVNVNVDVGDGTMVGVNVSVADTAVATGVVLVACTAGLGVHAVNRTVATSKAAIGRYRFCFCIVPLLSGEFHFGSTVIRPDDYYSILPVTCIFDWIWFCDVFNPCPAQLHELPDVQVVMSYPA
jgi:hypothetical protein